MVHPVTEHRLIVSTLLASFVICHYIRPALAKCNGVAEILTATHNYQEFTSPNYPFMYENNLLCFWRITSNDDRSIIQLDIVTQLMEYHPKCIYDAGEVYDVIHQRKELRKLSLVTILGASIGVFAFIIIIYVVIRVYLQVKKAMETRINRLIRRSDSTNQVHPCCTDEIFQYLNHGWPPPAYGEVYSSPMSPPPFYTEIDHDPLPESPYMPPHDHYTGRTDLQ